MLVQHVQCGGLGGLSLTKDIWHRWEEREVEVGIRVYHGCSLARLVCCEYRAAQILDGISRMPLRHELERGAGVSSMT